MSGNFNGLLKAQWKQGRFLCVGLDSDFEKIPESARKQGIRETIVSFNRAIIDATHDLVCTYKPNPAFYEAHGDEGWKALRETIEYIHSAAPDVPVILDAKRGDIGNTNVAYAESAFDHLHADAITVQPYPGREALQPFLDRKDKGVIVWCRTSNGGAGEFQDLAVDGVPLYQFIARRVAEDWNKNKNCALVVGATYPKELAAVRAIVGDLPILIPGIGAQNGDIEKTVQAGKDSKGQGMIIAASRSIIFASSSADFAEASRAKAVEFHDAIKKSL
ncbi:orotidine 5'-phosphate decarboxylase [Candidatus Kaiserbacteria bacterium RIFCSPLOWO2_12_FULL_53_8]|uniref:Orotidine-5'-phosphate decarboxylase n=2 Tax=Candidatus Kaiseribacteriota TaxID=1752734 RepID=A0A1F6CVQ8_9BACT|nr:MAG: orotidine 5'-phosphate decarboxylase [Candidatus Kaiserbacteria bacterium RIFCSPHIGHO2_01_FULL_53_29]OGG92341.1 MAG: orotidine 5'-phosphate decarboxylase [Candidatus Kaiserbacteria bacterium RIFCSPLOWO2_12_FULL_53_8]